MPLLNFQARFADAVERGEKCQTIRAYRRDKRDPKPGDTLYLYTGCRTKQARKLAEVKCTSASRIRMAPALEGAPVLLWRETRGMSGNAHMVSATVRESEAFAKRDGFLSWAAMRDWFDKTHGLPFEGLLIRWEAP